MKLEFLRNSLLIIFVITALTIAGCNSVPEGTIFSAYSGTEALRLSFMKNAPPDTVYAGTTFPVGIMLENAGATAVNGILVVSAPEFPETKMLPEKRSWSFSIPGKADSRTFIGGKNFTIFQLKAPDELGLNELNVNIAATACYKYQTKATTSFCVDTSIYDQSRKACSFRERTTFSSQGAPIAVREVEAVKLFQSTNEAKISFKIKVENVGDGVVVSDKHWDLLCSNSKVVGDPYAYFGRAYVSAELGGKRLSCSSRNYVDLSQKKQDVVSCETEPMPVNDQAYISPLVIYVNYGYVQFVNKEVVLKKLPGSEEE